MTDKSLLPPSAPQAKPRTFTPYVIGWAALATLSLVYLALLAAQPAFVAGILGAPADVVEADAALSPGTESAAAEMHTLRESMEQVRSELAEIKAQIRSYDIAARRLTGRVAALETPPEEQKVAAEAAPKGKKNAAEPAEKLAAATPAQKTAKDAKDAKDAKAAAKKKSGGELETGSVAQPAAGAITFGPATVTPAAVPPAPDTGRQVGVQIATGPSVDSLRLSWTLLNERHGDSLRAFEARYTTDATGPNQSYDLIVGPLANVDEARRLCQELALQATPCTVGRFTGDAL